RPATSRLPTAGCSSNACRRPSTVTGTPRSTTTTAGSQPPDSEETDTVDELAGTQLLLLQHQLVGWSPYLSFLQRQVPRHLADRLCEYVNLIDGRHVIGLWLNRDRGVVVDLVAFHPAVDPPGYDHTLQVLFNLNNDLRVRCLQEQARR